MGNSEISQREHRATDNVNGMQLSGPNSLQQCLDTLHTMNWIENQECTTGNVGETNLPEASLHHVASAV